MTFKHGHMVVFSQALLRVLPADWRIKMLKLG